MPIEDVIKLGEELGSEGGSLLRRGEEAVGLARPRELPATAPPKAPGAELRDVRQHVQTRLATREQALATPAHEVPAGLKPNEAEAVRAKQLANDEQRVRNRSAVKDNPSLTGTADSPVRPKEPLLRGETKRRLATGAAYGALGVGVAGGLAAVGAAVNQFILHPIASDAIAKTEADKPSASDVGYCSKVVTAPDGSSFVVTDDACLAEHTGATTPTDTTDAGGSGEGAILDNLPGFGGDGAGSAPNDGASVHSLSQRTESTGDKVLSFAKGALVLGAIAGVGYLGYRYYSKRKKEKAATGTPPASSHLSTGPGPAATT